MVVSHGVAEEREQALSIKHPWGKFLWTSAVIYENMSLFVLQKVGSSNLLIFKNVSNLQYEYVSIFLSHQTGESSLQPSLNGPRSFPSCFQINS